MFSSAFVGRDMIEIIESLREDGMLRYWGTSYGSQLGSTFVSMFPARVERVLLDAVQIPMIMSPDILEIAWWMPTRRCWLFLKNVFRQRSGVL